MSDIHNESIHEDFKLFLGDLLLSKGNLDSVCHH